MNTYSGRKWAMNYDSLLRGGDVGLNLDYECRIVTPMFMGGAEPLRAELRSPSFKGALRFWWRALNGFLPITELKKREGQLFGGTDKNQGRSKVQINILANDLLTSKAPLPQHVIKTISKGKTIPVNILDYLSFGTYKWNKEQRRNEFLKEYIEPGSFKLRLRIVGASDEQVKEIREALYLLSNFGGLGACSRNGYGSIQVNDPYFLTSPLTFLDSLDLPERTPEYTAFSGGLKYFKTKNIYDTWDQALANLGVVYRECRSSLEPKHQYDKRKYLANPLIADRVSRSVLNRRAKPYFMHVAPCGTGYEGRILYLPAAFTTDVSISKAERGLMDTRFAAVCGEMNELLAKHLEVVI